MFLLSGCDALKLGVMNHAGPIAASQWHLYVIVGIVLVFVAGPVLLLTPIIAWHYRLSNRNSAFRPDWDFSWLLEGLIWIPPTGIVIGLGFVLWNYTHTLDPYRPIASDQPALEIQAVALDWKWLFIYPDQRVAAVNQMVIPVGRPIHISLTSGTVMQSLLIPQLAGQIYAMAGMTTQLNLAASRPGTYRGENTQFNGTGFQNEKFNVIALPPADYAALGGARRAGLLIRSMPRPMPSFSDGRHRHNRLPSRPSRSFCSSASSPSLRSPDDAPGYLARGPGPLRLDIAALCSRLGKSHRQRDHRRRRRLDRHSSVLSSTVALITWFGKWRYLWSEWLTSLDHKKIGIMYIVLAFVMLSRALIEAVLMRMQQAAAIDNPGFLAPDHFAQLFSTHGSIMIFFMAMPFLAGPHQLCHAAPDRQPRRRLPAAELDQPVADGRGGRADDGVARHRRILDRRLERLPALYRARLQPRRGARLLDLGGDAGLDRIDAHGDQFRRHDL